MQCEVERRGRIFFPDFCNLCLRFAPTDRWLLGFHLIGNFDTDKIRNFQVVFEKCSNSTSSVTCKSDEEITEWVTGRFFLVLSN